MKVYVFTYNWADPTYGTSNNEILLYDSFEKAKEQFDKAVEDDKTEGLGSVAQNNDGYVIEEDTDVHYYVYEDGYAEANYTEIKIEEMEVL